MSDEILALRPGTPVLIEGKTKFRHGLYIGPKISDSTGERVRVLLEHSMQTFLVSMLTPCDDMPSWATEWVFPPWYEPTDWREKGIPSFGQWRNNGELILDAWNLGFIADEVLDLSYGYGNFWTEHRPKLLVANDLNPDKGDYHHDVRGEPPAFWLGKFGTVVWDPPYRLSGTRGAHETWRAEFDERYGLDTAGRKWEPADLIIEQMKAGLVFASKCVAKRGYVLVKCQDQVNSGKMVWETIEMKELAEYLGMRYVDRFDFPVRSQSQPKNRKQRHTRKTTSQLMVFKAA